MRTARQWPIASLAIVFRGAGDSEWTKKKWRVSYDATFLSFLALKQNDHFWRRNENVLRQVLYSHLPLPLSPSVHVSLHMWTRSMQFVRRWPSSIATTQTEI